MLVGSSGQVVTARTRGMAPLKSLGGTAAIQRGTSAQVYG